MGARTFRQAVASVLMAALAATMLATAPIRVAEAAEAVVGPPVPVLPARLLRAAMRADGERLRTTPRAVVDLVAVPTRAAADPLFRVTVFGTYPPRALRYVVMSGRLPVGYGVPRADQRAVVATTTDASVLTARLSVRYGDRPDSGTAFAPTVSPASDLPAAASGPYEVTRSEYDLGDRVFQPGGLPGRVELTADVHYPTDLTAGPYPLVLLLHGNHSTCERGDRSDFRWPCRDGWEPIPNHEGYDYLAAPLASHGYIVVSVSANGVNVLGSYLEDTGMRQRGALLEKHVDLWNDWNANPTGPFGDTFLGSVDLSRIGVMGHSRGGEGAVWQVLVDRERPSPYGIDAVLPLAPVDFTRVTLNEVPLGVVLPSCDGDVSDLQGVHFFDDSRYAVPGDPTPKSVVVVHGANHNFFNTVWTPSSGHAGTWNDSTCDKVALTPVEERHVGVAYVASFFRRHLGGEIARGRVWTGERVPSAIGDVQTRVSYLAPDSPSARLDVNRFVVPGELHTNTFGGAVETTDLGTFGWCENRELSPCVPGLSWSDIHLSWSWFGPVGPGLQQGVLGWTPNADGQARVRFTLPGGADVSALDYLGFRTVPNPGYLANDGVAYQDLVVVVEDGAGARAEVAAADAGNDALAFPFDDRAAGGHIVLHQMRFPLAGFTGVDLTDVVAVELAFTRTDRGVIDVADLAFYAGED
ncbi:MAG TPA: hypothetical protein VF140_06605 [Phycicoccus sp.]